MSQATTPISLAAINAEIPSYVSIHQDGTDHAIAETFYFECSSTVESGQLVVEARWESRIDHPASTPMAVTGYVIVELADGHPVIGEPTSDFERGEWVRQSPECETAERAAVEAAREAIKFAGEPV